MLCRRWRLSSQLLLCPLVQPRLCLLTSRCPLLSARKSASRTQSLTSVKHGHPTSTSGSAKRWSGACGSPRQWQLRDSRSWCCPAPCCAVPVNRYQRDWKRIEQHVGTKNAVQARHKPHRLLVACCLSGTSPTSTNHARALTTTHGRTAQIRSHAQKYFLKLERAGQVVPPPRQKRARTTPWAHCLTSYLASLR